MEELTRLIDDLASVFAVVDHTVMDELHMDADLMGPSRLEFHIQQCRIVIAFQHVEQCQCIAGILRCDGHDLTVLFTASDRGIDLPFIVLDDANLNAAVEAGVYSAFFNSGQNCGSPSRFYIQEGIYDAFKEKFIAAAEKAGLKLYLGSYPITPATDVLHELSKHKSCGVITVQCEDEIAGCSSALGASFAGALGVTSTSGPGICLKSEAMNLAVIMELPLVVLDVQRGGPATGLPTKSEQTDLLQALFGRNGESPMPVMAATSPTDCFDAAYQACKIALEHMTPVVLLTDAFVANGSGAFKLPEMAKLDPINPPYVPEELKGKWTPYMRAENGTRYWAVPGREGFAHILGGLEKDSNTGAISTNPENHDLMTRLRQQKIANIQVPDLEVDGDVNDADLLIVGFGSTYGHLRSAMDELRGKGYKVAQTHFKYLNPLPKNTAAVLSKYKKVVVAEQNMGQLAGYLRMKVDNFVPFQFNQVKGQPFVVEELVNAFEEIIKK